MRTEERMSLLIKRAKIFQLNPAAVSPETDIYIEEDQIRRIGRDLGDLPGKRAQGNRENPAHNATLADLHGEGDNSSPIHADRVIDAKGRYVMPGNVCAHNHFYSALSRGITSHIGPSDDFVSILRNLWWRLDRTLDSSSLFYSGLIAALEAIKAGTTTVIDHNASPGFIRGSLKLLKEAFQKCGLRGILSYEVTDRNGLQERNRGIEENVEFIQGQETAQLKGAVGAHAPFTLSDESLRMLSEAVAATGRGLHIHLSEDRYDLSHSHHVYGIAPAERLDAYHLLDEKSLIVHGVHLLEREAEILEEHSSFLVHNPRSNMNNSVGYCRMLSHLTNVAIGTDGMGSDMFEESKIGYFKSRDAGMGFAPSDLTRFLANGNMILERYFGKKFGTVGKGSTADLVILDYRNPTPVGVNNTAGHFIFGLSSQDVNTVVIGGRVVFENRQFPFATEELYRDARKEAKRLWNAIDDI
jgi:putative selenium metabolism protein SsnA